MRPLITLNSIGWVYLWHFSRPLGNLASSRGQAQHYIGYADDPDGDAAELGRRAIEHLAGRGARITKAAVAAGIEISLVATWRAPLSFEKYLKSRKEAPRLCPICCRQRNRRVRVIVPVEQLAFDFQEDVEPWPTGFEFPAPALTRPGWAEFQRVRVAGAALSDDWDDGLL